MDIKQYKEDAKRTMSNQWHLTELDITLLHCAIGVVTEFGELMEALNDSSDIDHVNIMEEIGDIFWYMTGFQRYYHDLDWEEVEYAGDAPISEYVNRGTISAINLLDKFKKWAFYGKIPSADSIKGELYVVYRMCVSTLHKVGYTVQETRQINIDKLKKRFPDKFNSEDAINRDLNTERKTLEGEL